jgi:hypothetical protein
MLAYIPLISFAFNLIMMVIYTVCYHSEIFELRRIFEGSLYEGYVSSALCWKNLEIYLLS